MNAVHIQTIILAAGRGTRMKAVEKNKVMFEVGGKPMIGYSVQAVKDLGIEKPIVVIGFAKDSVQQYLGDRVQYAVQEQAQGTADAVRSAMPLIAQDTDVVIVLYGDGSMFYTGDVLQKLLDHHLQTKAGMTLITTHTDPTGYGRILRDNRGKMIGIVEEKNATEEQKKIREISSGNAAYSASFLRRYLPMIERNAVSGEFYFTDIVELGMKHGELIETLVIEDPAYGIGINTPDQLKQAEEEMQKRTSKT